MGIIILFFFVLIIYLFLPKIELNGEEQIEISYKDKYEEKGYKATFFNNDITNKVKIINNIKVNKVGNYKIIYYIDFRMFKIKKIRYINIVDKTKPNIKVNNDKEVKICPGNYLPDLEYFAYDEYDGDITNKVKILKKDNSIVYSVSDSSGNFILLEKTIKKVDDEKPIIKLKGDDVIYIDSKTKYEEPGFIATDNCDKDLTNKVTVNGIVGNEIGTYNITYIVSDSSGNETSVTRTIIVFENNNSNINDTEIIQDRTIYLTFDDGPNYNTTANILDILHEEGVKATFFVTCNGPDYLIKRMYDEGHTVALHTASHDYGYIYSSVDNYFRDLQNVSDRVKRITGEESKIIRFPGGSSNTVSIRYKHGIMSELTTLVLSKGYHYFDWNIDSNDAGGASSYEIYNNVILNLSQQRSNIVLMHDGKQTTINAIRNIIRSCKNNGYTFEKININTTMVRHKINN